MAHLSDGALRRLYDEPLALSEDDRSHYRACAGCQERFATIAGDARHSLGLLAVPGATVDVEAALGQVRGRVGSEPRRLPVVARVRELLSPAPVGVGWRRPAAAGVLAAGLVAAMAFTPLAADIVQVFQPQQVTTVTVATPAQADVSSLQQFSRWGDVKTAGQPQLAQVETAAEAAGTTGLEPITIAPSKLPASLGGAPVTYFTTTKTTATVTFNGNAPAQLRGSTLTVTVGPAEVAVFGDLSKAYGSVGESTAGKPAGGAAGAASDTVGAAGDTAGEQQQIQQALSRLGPLMAIAETTAPKVTSSGVSVAQIKQALLATHPGPALTELINDFDSPAGNLPIPIPAGTNVVTKTVTVHGVKGTALGDNTGLGGGVVWIRGGKVYGVAGTIAVDEAVAVAGNVS